jgi:transposase InsO family protein
VVTTLPKVLLSWSSGKDSAWALHMLRKKGDVEVVGLLTTVNQTFDRVAMHAVRTELLRAQALEVPTLAMPRRSFIGLVVKTEVIERRGRWLTFADVENATLQRVDWFTRRRLLEPVGHLSPIEFERMYYRHERPATVTRLM